MDHISTVGFNRRGFLAGSAMAAAALAAARARAFVPPELGSGRVEPAWARLAAGLKTGKVLRPWDADFYLVALPNNLRYGDVIPAGIARCGSAADVAFAIRWARDNHIPLATRGGGHSYAGYSTTQGLMIETAWISQSFYDPNSGVLTVGSGARNRDLYRLLRQHDRAITHGRCPSVGASGFLLGGGIGFNMRGHGVACDQLVGSQIVLADSRTHQLSPTMPDKLDRDLFWASRGGGGGNFGITTQFALQSFSVAGLSMTVFDLSWSRTPDDRGAARPSVEAVGAKLMEVLDAAPDALGSRISFGAVTPVELAAGQDVTISLLGQFAGPRAELEAILAPVFEMWKPNGGDGIHEMPYWAAQDFLEENGYPTFWQERSAFVNRRPFDAEALAMGFKHLREWPGTRGYCDLRFFQTGGQMNAPAAGATAFVHRDSHWLMVIGLYYDEADSGDAALLAENHAWQDAFYEAMRPLAGGGAYQNFADPTLKDFRQAYYGGNLDRLIDIKRRADPDRVFNFPQAI